MGTPDFAVKSLDSLVKSGHEILAVYTQPDKPKGRGHKLMPSDVKVYALDKGFTVYQPLSLKNDVEIDRIKEMNPELIVVAAYGRILPKDVLETPKYGCLNVHASVLPKYRGAAPIQRSVIDGEKKTGVTIMQMNEGLDTGDILSIEEMEIGSEDTAGTMFEKLAVLGADMLLKVIDDIETCRANAVKQDESKATYAAMLNKSMTNIDWSWDSVKIDCLIRGLNPFYIAKTLVGTSVLKIHKAVPCEGKGKCGEVMESKNKLVVACGNNTALELVRVQGENGKTMDASDYLRGHPIEIGSILGGE